MDMLLFKIGKKQVLYAVLIALSILVWWLSFGAVAGCAHFDIPTFCYELNDIIHEGASASIKSECNRLAQASTNICSELNILGLTSFSLSMASGIFFISAL